MRVLALFIALSCPVAAEQIATGTGWDGFVTMDRLPVPDQPLLAQGRIIWGDTCENCHGGKSLTGAPKITSIDAWAPRFAQGFDVLIPHAIEGFTGPKYTQMPARGGNSDLTDADVGLAVAFMVWASGGTDEALGYLENNWKD